MPTQLFQLTYHGKRFAMVQQFLKGLFLLTIKRAQSQQIHVYELWIV